MIASFAMVVARPTASAERGRAKAVDRMARIRVEALLRGSTQRVVVRSLVEGRDGGHVGGTADGLDVVEDNVEHEAHAARLR